MLNLIVLVSATSPQSLQGVFDTPCREDKPHLDHLFGIVVSTSDAIQEVDSRLYHINFSGSIRSETGLPSLVKATG